MEEGDHRALSEILEARGRFGHREHLELAWTLLSKCEIETAKSAMASSIRHVALIHGEAVRYHDTITRSWVHLVARHREHSDARTFDAFITDNAELMDRRLLSHHYSPEVLAGAHARASWTEPDLCPLPALHTQ
ncbi:MAG TPA: hypothetical protein VG295_08305 [Solirubrobacteraceae bacterium]|nr:hypothetical protein [Solirubrobacteraceae bacterium]